MTQGDQKGCYQVFKTRYLVLGRRKAYVLKKDGYVAAARTKQDEGDEYTGIRTAGTTLGNKETYEPRARRKREGGKRENRTLGGDSNMPARLC